MASRRTVGRSLPSLLLLLVLVSPLEWLAGAHQEETTCACGMKAGDCCCKLLARGRAESCQRDGKAGCSMGSSRPSGSRPSTFVDVQLHERPATLAPGAAAGAPAPASLGWPSAAPPILSRSYPPETPPPRDSDRRLDS